MAGLTDNVLALWYCVHDVSATTCGKILDLAPATIQKLYNMARLIMTGGALKRQCAIHFGALHDHKICDFEPDEAVLFSWSE